MILVKLSLLFCFVFHGREGPCPWLQQGCWFGILMGFSPPHAVFCSDTVVSPLLCHFWRTHLVPSSLHGQGAMITHGQGPWGPLHPAEVTMTGLMVAVCVSWELQGSVPARGRAEPALPSSPGTETHPVLCLQLCASISSTPPCKAHCF